MGAHLDQTMNKLRRVKSETLGYLTSTVYYQKTHAYAVQRMRTVHASADYQALPRWAKSEIAGYEEAYFSGIHNHLTEYKHRRIADGAYISSSEVNWGKREIDSGASFWKGTDIMYSGPDPDPTAPDATSEPAR
jgi:hypothetical protein